MSGSYSEDLSSLLIPILETIFVLLYLLFTSVSHREYNSKQEKLENTPNMQQEMSTNKERNRALEAGAANHMIRQGMIP